MPCPHCTDHFCVNGSKCHRGLFAADDDLSFDPRAADLHKRTQKQSKRGTWESEHVFPMAATKKVFPGAKPRDEPTMSIAYGVHRGGQSGAGGGVSSTGSSSTAKGWSAHLVSVSQSAGFAEGLRLSALDEANAHIMNDAFTGPVLMQLIQVINQHCSAGRITPAEAGTIINGLTDYYLNRRSD